MLSTRSRAVWTGVFFIVAAVAAFAGLALYQGVLQGSSSAAAADAARWGAFCEVLLVIGVVGTAVALYPVLRETGPSLALAYVVGRTLEAAIIMVGAIAVLVAADVASAGPAMVALHDWTFLFGPGLTIGVNTTILAWLMWRSGLAPRVIAGIGLIGGPLVFVSSTAVLLGVYSQVSLWGGLAALPVFAWEMSLAGWLIVKGFGSGQARPEPIVTGTLVGGGIA